MNKRELDILIQNIWHDCFHKTVKSCMKEWKIDFMGKDKELLYPVIPRVPDTQEQVIKATRKHHEELKIIK